MSGGEMVIVSKKIIEISQIVVIFKGCKYMRVQADGLLNWYLEFVAGDWRKVNADTSQFIEKDFQKEIKNDPMFFAQ